MGPTCSLVRAIYAYFIFFFIFLLLGALYRMICKNSEKKLGENSLNVHFVKLFSKFFFDDFGCFLMSDLIELMSRAICGPLCKKYFFLNVSTVNFFFAFFDGCTFPCLFVTTFIQRIFDGFMILENVNFWRFDTFHYLKEAQKSHFKPIYLAFLVWFTDHPVEGAQHQKN